MINLTIDNHPIEVPEGTTILSAARQAGIEIPTLCDHPHLTPFGGCRLCMVEIDGFRTLQSACTMPVMNNMVIRTSTEKVKASRKFVLGLIFSERNHFCPYCQVSGGDCELQNAAYEEEMTHWPIPPKWQPQPVDASHPYFVLEHNRCILCRRCIRACSELVGINTLGVEERGPKTFVIADLNVPLGQSTCVSCGMCVQVCPTGALIDRKSAYLGLEEHLEVQNTICTGCSLGCGVRILSRNNQAVRIEGDWDSPVNAGVICKTGRYAPLFDNRERLNSPLMRKNGALEQVTWEEALDAITSRISANGNVAALASTRLNAEALHLFKMIFADGLKNETVTTLEEGSKTDIPSQLAAELGKPFEGTLCDVNSGESFLFFGGDLVNQHEVAGFFTRRTIQHGNPLIVVDPNENGLDEFANCTLKPKAGFEMDLLEGLTAAITRLGLNKAPFTANAVDTLNKASKKCGVATDLLLEAAFKFASPEKPVIIYDSALVSSLETLKALLKLAEVSGAVLFNPKGGANSLAAAQYGLDKPFKLNGHETVFMALGDDDPTPSLAKNLEGVPYLIIQASHVSPLTAAADVVLPVAAWLEQEGHYLSADGRLQKTEKCLSARSNEAKTDFDALTALANSLNISTIGSWKDELIQRPSPVEIRG